MLPQNVPPQLAAIVAAKDIRRRELAALTWEDKIDIVQRMWVLKDASDTLPLKQRSSWSDVCALFTRLLGERIKANATLTEDSLRYTFFFALVQSGFCDHTQVSLEERHPAFNTDKEIDLVVRMRDVQASLACEFKFDRAIPSKKNLNVTKKIGALFADIYRLAHIPENVSAKKFLVYVSDATMARYLARTNNEPLALFDLKPNESAEIPENYDAARSETFQDTTTGLGIPCRVVNVCHENFDRDYHLRIWQIYPLNHVTTIT